MAKTIFEQKSLNDKIFIAITAMAVLLLYIKAVNFNFVVWDDPAYLTMNIDVLSFDINKLITEYYNGNYHPITMMLYSLQYKIFGLNSSGYHLVNVLLHCINTVLLYVLLREYKVSVVITAMCTLIWALHPMRVEAVAWIVGLKDLVSTFFGILFVLVYKKNSSAIKGTDCYKLAILYLLAILSKGTAIVLLIYIFLDGYNYKKSSFKEKYWFYIVLCLMSVFVVVLNLLARSDFQGILMEGSPITLTTIFQGIYRLGMYFIVSTLSPLHMSFTPYLSGGSEWYIYSITGFMVIALSIAFLIKFARTNGQLMILWLSCIGSYLPSIFLPVVGYTMDRFSYFPTIWFILCVGILLNKYIDSQLIRNKIVTAVMLTFAMIAAMATNKRIDVWRDSVTLWEDAIELYSDKPGQWQNLAWAYSNLGWYYNALEQYDRSMPYLRKAIEIDSSIAVYHLNYTEALIEQKDFVKAAEHIKVTSQLEPENLLNYFFMAKMIGKNINEGKELIEMMEENVSAEEKDYRYYYYLACLYLNIGENDAALQKALTAINLKENSYDIHILLAELYYKNNRQHDAKASLEKARDLDKNNHNYLKKYLLYEYDIAEKDIYLKNRRHSVVGL